MEKAGLQLPESPNTANLIADQRLGMINRRSDVSRLTNHDPVIAGGCVRGDGHVDLSSAQGEVLSDRVCLGGVPLTEVDLAIGVRDFGGWVGGVPGDGVGASNSPHSSGCGRGDGWRPDIPHNGRDERERRDKREQGEDSEEDEEGRACGGEQHDENRSVDWSAGRKKTLDS